jgi:hypothetical protein
MRRLRQTIKTYDIHFWLDSFLQAAFDSLPQEVPMAGFSTFLSSIDRL